jgi:GT2 family glycosyltransferase
MIQASVIQISIIIPVFNQSALSVRCLTSLLHHTQIARELIIIDNHSTDDTAAQLQRFQPLFINQGWHFQVIQNTSNVGFGRACNQGLKAAQGDYLAVLNNDTWLPPAWDQLLLHRQIELQSDLIGPAIDETPFDPQETPLKLQRMSARNKGKFRTSWVSILMFFPKQTLATIGLFDERYFVTYEDRDLRERMERAGLHYHQIGDCWIWHFSKGTRGRETMPPQYELTALQLFQKKWGFDPRLQDNTRLARLKKRWNKIKLKLGLF